MEGRDVEICIFSIEISAPEENETKPHVSRPQKLFLWRTDKRTRGTTWKSSINSLEKYSYARVGCGGGCGDVLVSRNYIAEVSLGH